MLESRAAYPVLGVGQGDVGPLCRPEEALEVLVEQVQVPLADRRGIEDAVAPAEQRRGLPSEQEQQRRRRSRHGLRRSDRWTMWSSMWTSMKAGSVTMPPSSELKKAAYCSLALGVTASFNRSRACRRGTAMGVKARKCAQRPLGNP